MEHPRSTHDLGKTIMAWKRRNISSRNLQLLQIQSRYPLKWKFPQSEFLLAGRMYVRAHLGLNRQQDKMASKQFVMGQLKDLMHTMQLRWHWKCHPICPEFHEDYEHLKYRWGRSNVQVFIEDIWTLMLKRHRRTVQCKGIWKNTTWCSNNDTTCQRSIQDIFHWELLSYYRSHYEGSNTTTS